jgi:PPOX class probable F420-dependent enzyme
VTTELAKGKYLLLTTFRKDGTPVPTPVWVVADGDEMFVWSGKDTGKVKRIRRDGAVRIAPCDARGNPTGESTAAHAELVDDTASDRVRELIGKKYGIFGKVTLLGSKIRRGRTGTVGIAIVPSS